MKPSKENIFRLLAELEQNGGIPLDGPVSVFASQYADGLRGHPYQLVVRTSGDTVFVRASRLPFARPLVFSRQALRAFRP